MSAACCVRRRSRMRASKRATGEITPARAQGGRGPRDRARDREAGRGRPAGDHRRRIPPLVVASRFPVGPRRRREVHDMNAGIQFAGVNTRAEGVQVTGKLGWLAPHPMIEHFKFVQATHQADAEDDDPVAVARSTAGRRRRRSIRNGLSRQRTRCSPISARPIARRCAQFADAGCRYLQLDEVFIAMLCDPKYRDADDGARRRSRKSSASIYGDLINAAMSDIPADMTITMHLCRGNYQIDLHGRRRLRRRAGDPVQQDQRRTAISWSTTTSAPAASSRCACCRRARPSCSAS